MRFCLHMLRGFEEEEKDKDERSEEGREPSRADDVQFP